MPEIGQTISQCWIIKKLGGGKMGLVHKAIDTRQDPIASLRP